MCAGITDAIERFGFAHAFFAVVDQDDLKGFVVAHLDGLRAQICWAFVAFGVDGEDVGFVDFAIGFQIENLVPDRCQASLRF